MALIVKLYGPFTSVSVAGEEVFPDEDGAFVVPSQFAAELRHHGLTDKPPEKVPEAPKPKVPKLEDFRRR